MFTLNDILKPTLLILIAIFVLYIYNHLVVKDLKLCCDNTENYSHYDLVVGILSSRGNFDLRQSLRESWVGYARRHSSLNKRLSATLSFSFVMKTDDDCFVNLETILQEMESHNLKNTSKLWWGSFRTDWLIERQGKWAEPDYPGVAYPTFACGAGSIISSDIVHWLAKNEKSLKRYQGEDVSMGIWLSAIAPEIYKDERWSCFGDCQMEMFTLPEQDADSLLYLWENFMSCGNPCKC
ncbi:UDP-GalNAc:beta-1,3-N-acetylgalactosaminyltransferase 2-like isoform X2 [Xenia sp. Carnegie-2017]|uniref:UDP-GalNAc:beta-1, 3-N-acetylgalactosaminyltransferase 2-like isoform X2 n=1 Tax=Xenia sp. Carnegie-2017 TaxID=2897299 RepID=UPI001F04EC74|nr:UDP-GalNAc:beta-1,3-N-acetylgalactosaminyltransferase 2-like isoform X2 [Xenia sp. Carnegie-2017]